MTKESKPITAGELMLELEHDKDYQARQKERALFLARKEEMLSKDEVPIIEAVGEVGIDIDSIWDFVNSDDRYPEAIPVLIEHLSGNYHPRTVEGLLRALTIKEASGKATNAVITLLKAAVDDEVKYAAGNALSIIAIKENADELKLMIADEKFRKARGGLIKALARIEGPNNIEFIMKYLSDEDSIAAVIDVLGKIGTEVEYEVLKSYASHNDSWVRNKAKRALKKIEKRFSLQKNDT